MPNPVERRKRGIGGGKSHEEFIATYLKHGEPQAYWTPEKKGLPVCLQFEARSKVDELPEKKYSAGDGSLAIWAISVDNFVSKAAEKDHHKFPGETFIENGDK